VLRERAAKGERVEALNLEIVPYEAASTHRTPPAEFGPLSGEP